MLRRGSQVDRELWGSASYITVELRLFPGIKHSGEIFDGGKQTTHSSTSLYQVRP